MARPTRTETMTTAPMLSAVPRVGDVAPDFTLPSTSGAKVTLSAERGSAVLLAFFPLAFSETCTKEFCELRDEWAHFEGRVTVHPISVDSTYALGEYKAKFAIPVDMLSDLRREASIAYGVFLPQFGFANRAYFLIDREGVIRWAHVEENPGQRRPTSELLAELDKLG